MEERKKREMDERSWEERRAKGKIWDERKRSREGRRGNERREKRRRGYVRNYWK